MAEHKYEKNAFAGDQHAIIILHEIYGVNEFIQNQRRKYTKAGFSVFYPDLLKRAPFAYNDAAKAYDFFFEQVGLSVYAQINEQISKLKAQYSKVFLLGFSVGATLAWRCCENPSCSGIIAYYGSRIREFTDLRPACPTLLIFAKEDNFDVKGTIEQLKAKPNVFIAEYYAKHGFFDNYSPNYNAEQAAKAEMDQVRFIEMTQWI